MEEQIDQISRRRLLRRLGAGTAAAWATPVLSSITTPAYAQASPTCAPLNCENPEQCGPGASCTLPPECNRNFSACTVLMDGSCFCTDGPFCGADPICQTDADCERFGPNYRCGRMDPNCACGGDVACLHLCGAPGRPKVSAAGKAVRV